MASAYLHLLPVLFLVSILSPPSTADAVPVAAPWPPQFHALLLANASNGISVIDLWYDLPNGRNFNIIQKQLGDLLYDLEWDNGTSYYYTLRDPLHCSTVRFPVGILRPNWMDGAQYLGQETRHGFLCNVWTKADFIVYYEDVQTKRPVHWLFTTTGRSIDVMTFEVGAVLEDEKWQAPPYCFEGKGKESRSQLHAEAVQEGLSLKDLWKVEMMPPFQVY